MDFQSLFMLPATDNGCFAGFKNNNTILEKLERIIGEFYHNRLKPTLYESLSNQFKVVFILAFGWESSIKGVTTEKSTIIDIQVY